MGKLCQGGLYDGMAILGTMDELSCRENGGAVVSSGSGGYCAVTSVASARATSEEGASAAATWRAARNTAPEHPLIAALVELNRTVAPVIDSIVIADANDPLLADLGSVVVDVGTLARSCLDTPGDDHGYTAELHQRIADVVREVGRRAEADDLVVMLDRVVKLAEPMVGLSSKELASEVFTDDEDIDPRNRETELVYAALPSDLVEKYSKGNHYSTKPPWTVTGDLPVYLSFDEAEARAAISKKARALGSSAGKAAGDVTPVPGGFMRRYQHCDIYYGKPHGAFEVRGDIKAKYDHLNGPSGPLGLPVTDETSTPDGIGRYNHFAKNGSIYWTPDTGPMMVRGRIRDLWSQQGWELGPLGYPVADEYHLPGLVPPASAPDLSWSAFQNGMVLRKENAVATALAAEISPAALKGLIRTFFDRALHAQDSSLGLEANVDTLAVSGWSYGFFTSSSRLITYRLHGFYDNGWLPDSTFEVDIRLRFTTAWLPALFGYPAAKSVVAILDYLRVHASGLGNGQLANGLRDGIWKAFHRGGPDPAHSEVMDGAMFITSFPTGADLSGKGNIDVIDILTTAQGGLQVLVNPIPPSIGGLRRTIAQNTVDGFLANF